MGKHRQAARGVRFLILATLVLLAPWLGSSRVQAQQRRLTIAAHAMPLRAAIVSLQLAGQVFRLEGSARHFLRDQSLVPSIHLEIQSTRDVAASVRALGGTVEADLGTLLAAVVPAGSVDALARVPGVVTLYPAQQLHEDLDQSIPDIRANLVWDTDDLHGVPIQGRHVLVGIVGTGLDLANPDFKNSDGTTRVAYLWDQSGNGSISYGRGYECSAATINAGACAEQDTDGHDTHVAGIAAGNGTSSTSPKEIGVAPQADLIVVKVGDLNGDNVIAAWKYMTDRARQLGEPIVINNSFGGMLTPHDGSEPESLAVDKLSGPGRIFVAAAGNSGNDGIHVDGQISPNTPASIPFTATGDLADVGMSFFYSASASVTVDLTDTDTGQTYSAVTQGSNNGVADSSDGQTHVLIQSGHWNDQTNEADVLLHTDNGNVGGHYTVTLQGQKLGAPVRFDGWIADDGSAAFATADNADTLSDPADAHSIITVGNYVTRLTWTGADGKTYNVCDAYLCLDGRVDVGDIKASSSSGPTADGRQKPDIAAPGTMIISSLSKDAKICSSDDAATDSCIPPALLTPDRTHLIETGTSMSAPHVAGTIALMLQVDPQLDPQTADNILRAAARHDSFTGADAWTPAFGAGKLDAYAAVMSTLSLARSLPTATPTAAPTSTPTPGPTPTATRPPPTVGLLAKIPKKSKHKAPPRCTSSRKTKKKAGHKPGCRSKIG